MSSVGWGGGYARCTFLPANSSRCHVIPFLAFTPTLQNIAVLHKPDSGVRLLHHSGNVRPGSRSWVEVRVAAVLPVVLGFEHTRCEPPNLFVDQLIHADCDSCL